MQHGDGTTPKVRSAAVAATETDEALFEAWAGGDSAAGSRLVRRHFGAVFRFFRTKLDRGIEDLAQRTFLACVEARGRFRGESSFRTFLLGIARMQLLRHLQRELPRTPTRLSVDRIRLPRGAGFGSPSAALAGREEQRLLLAALRRMPLDLQMIVELHYWEELSVSELAQVLEIPPGTVKTRLHRARRTLRTIIESFDASGAIIETTLRDLDGWARSLRDKLARET